MAMALCVLSASNAEIQVKDLDGTNVEITFTYKDAKASEMGAIGSFNSWTVPGTAMTKNVDGVWEVKIKALATDEIQYKFYSGGTWIVDTMSPDKKDDGYGGTNGLIIVADILSGVTPAVPNAAPAATAADGDASEPVAKVYPSKLNFGMYTIIGSKTTFSTQGVVDKTDKGLETDSTGLFGKSFWKIGGTLLPNVTAWFEMKAFEGYKPVWAQDARGVVSPKLNDGAAGLGVGLATNPVNYINGGNSVINSLKTGLDTPYIVWETGYGYAKPQKRTAVLWETLGERDANNGYMRFDLGPKLKKAGDYTIEATIAPNMIFGTYSMFSWLGVSAGPVKADFQYDFKSAEGAKLEKIFNKIYHQDYILGIKTKIASVDVSAQGMLNQFSEADFEARKNTAGEVKASWTLPKDVFGVTAGYRYTGDGSELLYGTNADALGDKGKQRVLMNFFGKPVESVKIGVDTSVTLTSNYISENAYELYAKPYTELNLAETLGKKSSLNVYIKTKYNLRDNTEYAGSESRFLFNEAGAKLSITDPVKGKLNTLDVYYGLNNSDDNKMFNTLIAVFGLPKDATVELGLGIRTVHDSASGKIKDNNNLMGFSLGSSWKIPSSRLKTPLLYGAFVYNMDPYDDGSNSLKFVDYVTDGGVNKNDGKAQLRLLLKWDF